MSSTMLKSKKLQVLSKETPKDLAYNSGQEKVAKVEGIIEKARKMDKLVSLTHALFDKASEKKRILRKIETTILSGLVIRKCFCM